MRRNAGPIYQIKEADADRVDAELTELITKNQQLIDSKYERLRNIEADQNLEIQHISRNNLSGPAARIDALSRLTSGSQAIWIANWFIILLFVAVETAPVFVKLISPRGPYDHLLFVEERGIESAMHEQLAKQNVIIKKKTREYPAFEKEYIDTKLEASLDKG